MARALIAGTAASLFAGVGLGSAAQASATPPHATPAQAAHQGPAPAAAKPLTDALSRAKATGHPVAVDALTTATTDTVANPSGTFTMTTHAQPVRVQRNGTWVAIDTTLHRNGDGTVSPAAGPTGLVLSGGGRGPLAAVTKDGHRLAVSFPAALPAPALSGDTATYREALPGIDVVVTATAQGGFSEVLVVKTPAAAANPLLATLRLPTAGSDLHVSADALGDLRAANPAGQIEFTAPRAAMWDSAPGGSASSVSGPGDHARVAAVAAKASASGVDLTPDATLLHRPDATFPEYVDPTWQPNYAPIGAPSYDEVQAGCPSAQNYDSTSYGDPGVGYNAFPEGNCNTGAERSFFQFGLPAKIWHTHIVTATLGATEVGSADCTARTVSAYVSGGGIGSSTDWGNQPSQGTFQSSQVVAGAGRSGCSNSAPASFSVLPWFHSSAFTTQTSITFGLYGDETSGATSLKRFAPNPSLTIEYNSYPGTPTAAGTNPQPINGSSGDVNGVNTPYGYIGDNDTTFFATLSDPDGGLVGGHFKITDLTANKVLLDNSSKTADVSSGQQSSVTVPRATLEGINGHTVAWQVQAYDGLDWSGWTSTMHFIVDTTKPVPPVVSSPTQGSPTSPGPSRTPSEFDISPNGSTGTMKYGWALNAPLSTTNPLNVVTAASDGTAKITASPRPGPNTLSVYAISSSGTESAIANFAFNSTPPATADVAGDFTGSGHPDLLYAGTDGNVHMLTGTGGGALTASSTRMTTGGGFTGALLSHGDFGSPGNTGALGGYDDMQDLLARQSDGNLYFYPGTGDGAPFDPTQRTQILLPSGSPFTWAQMTQVVGAQDINGDSQWPDMFAVSGDALYSIPSLGVPGAYGTPVQISASGWTGKTLVDAGNMPATGGFPALWVRDNASGELDLYTAPDASDPAGSAGSTKTVYSAGGFTAATTPRLYPAGQDASGNPALWGVDGEKVGAVSYYSSTTATAPAMSAASKVGTLNPVAANEDVNGDGAGDAVTLYDYGSGHVALFTQTGDPGHTGALSGHRQVWSGATWGSGSQTKVVTGDFNGDGKTDIGLWYDYGGNHVAFFTLTADANGDGGFAAPIKRWESTSWTGTTRWVAPGDFTGDGKTDLVLLVDYGAWHDALFTLAADADGDGGFGAPVDRWDYTNWGSGSQTRVVTGDFNGDGLTDIGLWYDYADHTHVGWFTMDADANGDGGFSGLTEKWDDTAWGGGTKLLTTGDFTGDGRSDLAIWYDHGSGHETLYTLTADANGDGGFAAPVSRFDDATFGTGTRFMTASDYNGDGTTDIAIWYNYGGENQAVLTFTADANGDGGLGGPVNRWQDTTWGGGTSTFE